MCMKIHRALCATVKVRRAPASAALRFSFLCGVSLRAMFSLRIL